MIDFILLLLAIIGLLLSIAVAIIGACLLLNGIFEVELGSMLSGVCLLVVGVVMAIVMANFGAYVTERDAEVQTSVEAPSSNVCSCCEGGCQCCGS